MEFLNPQAFLFFLVIPFIFLIKNKKLPFSKKIIDKIVIDTKFNKKKRFFVFLIAFIFIVLALARPVIPKKETTIKINSSNVIILLSGGKEMACKDIYPNRFEAAISKLEKLFSNFTTQNVSVILVMDKSYLISPFTTDYDSIIYLLKHINKKNLFKTEPNFDLAFLNANRLSKKSIKLTISEKYFDKKNTISYIFALTPCNSQTLPSKGIKFTYSNNDIKEILTQINKHSKNKTIKIKDNLELFYFPLLFGILLFFIGSISIRFKK